MTPEEIAVLAEKVKFGTASKDESVAFFQAIEEGVVALRSLVKEAVIEEKTEELKEIF